ncbi:hypothetical protein [Bifidobacterium longum]|uniref:hypothetical protein n=1 Tax=Bifidobacterium longum TaxID=216816 RepID=UPI001EE7F952|nr:hypothetical protein [Bifidobacterium longum]
MLHHLGRRHRRGEIQLHRTLSFLKTEHTKILPFGLQENVRSPIYLHSTQSMQQHYSSKPIEQNSKSRLAQPQDGFDDNGEAVLAYFLEAFTASTAFCSD